MEYILTVRECLEDIRNAQKELARAHYHLRVAIELSMHQRDKNEKEGNKRDSDGDDFTAYRRKKSSEGIHFSEA